MNGHRILIVEDEFVVACEISERLTDLGYQVVGSAVKGEEALNLAEQHQPDLVLMDIRIQGAMDGITVAEELNHRFHIPVIFLTANSEDTTLERAKKAEPYGYILKPFDGRELKSTIEIALYKHALEQDLRRMNRLYDVLIRVNRTIVRTSSRDALFQSVCDLLVERGEIDFAWIGWLDPTSGKNLVVASSGKKNDPAKKGVFLNAVLPTYPGNPSKAIADQVPYICNQRSGPDCSCLNAKEDGMFGFNACGSFPLSVQGRVCGTLNLGTRHRYFFQEHERELLEQVTSDLCFVLEKMEGDTRKKQAEEALRITEDRYRMLFENVMDACLLTFPEGDIIAANRAACSMFGWTEEELQRLGRNGIIDTSDRRLAPALEERAAKGCFRGELTFLRQDGSRFPAEISSVIYGKGEQRFTSTIIRDITSKKQAEEALRESESRFRSLFENAPVAYQSLDMKGCYLDCNQQLCDLMGYTAGELLGKNFVEFWSPPTRPLFKNAFAAFVHAGTVNAELELLCKDGKVIDVILEGSIQRDQVGNFVRTHCILTNITERKQMESALRRWADAFQFCAHGIAMENPSTNQIILCNPAFAKILGRQQDEITGHFILDLYNADDHDQVRQWITDADRVGQVQYESSMVHRDGTLIPVQMDVVSVGDIDGEVQYRIATMQNIAERKRIEEELSTSEAIERGRSAELRALVEAIPSPVWFSYDRHCKFITGNRAAQEILGILSEEENLSAGAQTESQAIFEVWRDGVRLEPDQLPMQRAVTTGTSIQGEELKFSREGAADRWVYTNSVPLFSESGEVRGCICVAMDITKLKQAKQSLEENERKYRKLFEIESDALFLIDHESLNILDANTAAVEVYGYEKEELLNMSIDELSVDPEKTISSIYAKLRSVYNRQHRKKDGTIFTVDITATYFVMDGNPVQLAAVRDVTERIRTEEMLKEKTDHLMEVNSALKALLRQRETDRKEHEDAIESNMKHLVLPYLESLKKSTLTSNQRSWIEILESHLSQITSHFARRVTLQELNFSNAELKVATLVRDGKSTKEIAAILMIAEKTVSAHRDSIRRKLSLRGKKGGLRYLLLNLN